MHIGNAINIKHNLTKMIMNPIDNVMLIKKWNCKVEVFCTINVGSPPVLGGSSFHRRVCVYIYLCNGILLVGCGISLW
jgi:hypothetical protein